VEDNESGAEAYTVQEAARILRTTERTVRRRLERGDLEGTRDPTTGRWSTTTAN
jgi:excisionase family DNA binding protein